MHEVNRDKRNANILLATFGALSLLCLSLPLAGPVRAFRACVAYLAYPVPFLGDRAVERFVGLPAGMARLLKTDVENRRLREGIRRVPLLEAELASLRLENERLRGALGMKPPAGTVLRWARVIERDAANWNRALVINAGKDDGVEPGSPALALDRGRLGAVGRVTDVSARVSKVLLLTDEMSSLAAYSPAKQWEGLVEGVGGARLRINYLPLDAEIVIGEAIYTSATSATFPPDILIGSISRLYRRDPFLTFQSAEVAPSIRTSAIKEVLILAPRKPEPGADRGGRP